MDINNIFNSMNFSPKYAMWCVNAMKEVKSLFFEKKTVEKHKHHIELKGLTTYSNFNLSPASGACVSV